MKKKTTEIATNTSSGAEKVETIEKQAKTTAQNGAEHAKKTMKTIKTQANKASDGVRETNTVKNTAKEEAALGNGKEKVNTPPHGLAEKEAAVAKARVEVALTRKEMQEQKKAERLKRMEEKKIIIAPIALADLKE